MNNEKNINLWRLTHVQSVAIFPSAFNVYVLPANVYIVYTVYTTVFPLSCTDGRYFYHISGTALFSVTNYDFFGAIVIFLLFFGYTKFKSRKWL